LPRWAKKARRLRRGLIVPLTVDQTTLLAGPLVVNDGLDHPEAALAPAAWRFDRLSSALREKQK
jgi:hypothetical protein